MIDTLTPEFDNVRKFVQAARQKGKDWSAIPKEGWSNQETANWLSEQIDDQYWPASMTLEAWYDIKDREMDFESRRKTAEEARNTESDEATLCIDDEEQGFSVPEGPQSSWQLYRMSLSDAGWSDTTIEDLESSTLTTLRRLKIGASNPPTKGLIIGHVQSGKTANMAGLINMAADWGFNFFIVLSGTIENLRKQTEQRLLKDLKSGNLTWRALSHLRGTSPPGEQSQSLQFAPGNNGRFFTVSLKNGARLKGLLAWMKKDKKSLSQMKILILDDEADQAGINTAKVSDQDRKPINELILQLAYVEGRAVNYIGYTATPYANVLNEGPGKTLYPSDFIRSLRTSNEYFGCAQIFGIDGMLDAEVVDIWREVSDSDLEQVDKIHKGAEDQCLPEALQDAIAWFLCSCATRRFRGQDKPTSMLVHTSQRQACHTFLQRAIQTWLRQPPHLIKTRCENIWERETARLTLDQFRWQFPDYGRMDKITDYPNFLDLTLHLDELLAQVSPIYVDREADDAIAYHKGVHLCIDNCAYTGINDEGEHFRLLYPDESLGFASAFIVVGGATLSRGLTLEGLVSTFFLRTSSLGDSLMQMGRWFGYRNGYELLPRIWTTETTRDKFRFLAETERALREDLRDYEEAGCRPVDFGPRVTVHPLVSYLRITSANRMQGAIEVDYDFTGITNQTIIFENDIDWLTQNITATAHFLNQFSVAGKPNGNCIVWSGICFDVIAEYLRSMRFHSRSRIFSRIDSFISWFIEKGDDFAPWSVIVAGRGRTNDTVIGQDTWEVPGGRVGKVHRSKLKRRAKDGSISIGALLAPADQLADASEDDQPQGTHSKAIIAAIRAKAGLEATPQLIIYRIDKDSEPNQEATNREILSAPADVIGLCLCIPGKPQKGSSVRAIRVRIESNETEVDEDDLSDDEGN